MAGDQDARREPIAERQPDMGALGDDVGFQIHITRRALWSALRTARGKGKERTSSGYVSSLLLIGTNPGISPSQIATALVLDMPNVVQLVRMLSDAGLIERRRNAADKRRLALTLTPEGRARVDEIMAFNHAQARNMTSKLTEAERRQLITLLGKVRLSIEAAQKEAQGAD